MNTISRSTRAASLTAAAFALVAALPAQAQFGGFGGLLGGAKKTEPTTSDGCPQGKKKSVGASILGSVAGSVASRAAGKFASFVPIPEVANTLTNAIACKLDEKEQKQAAEATLAATRGDESGEVAVGTTAEWTSSSREGVKGKSTVIAANEKPGKGMPKDAKCITVTDVIIVNGEETTANKRMCRAPGQARYALMA
jgi:surface antigen